MPCLEKAGLMWLKPILGKNTGGWLGAARHQSDVMIFVFPAETCLMSWRAVLLGSHLISLLRWADPSQLLGLWLVNAVRISQQPTLQPDAGPWLQATGCFRGHLLRQKFHPGPWGTQVTASWHTSGFMALPGTARWDIPTGGALCGQLRELRGSLWWNLKSS